MMSFIENKKILISFLPLFLLMFPTNKSIGLDGFPFEGKVEVLLFIVCICLPFFAKNLDTMPQRHFRIIALLTFLFILTQSISNNYSFQACYSTESTPVSNFEMNFNTENKCQFSFDKPLNKDITRTDYFLNFNQHPQNNQSIEYTNWNLYFLNQTGFNFYDKSFYGGNNDLDIPIHWILKDNNYERVSYNQYSELKKKEDVNDFDYGFNNLILPIEPSRSWLSFGVNWSSKNLSNYQEKVKISYVGEVRITIDKKEINLEPSYTEPNIHILQIPKGASVELDYFYRFNGLINSIPNIPYASFALTDLDDNFINIYQSNEGRVLNLVSLLIFLIIFFVIFLSIVSSKKNLTFYILGSCAVLFITEILPSNYADIVEILIILLTVFYIAIKKKYKIHNFLLAILTITLLSVKNMNINGNTLYSLGGSDPLKYESWSQQIVYFFSLQGGEDIYLYQPGYRYLLSLFHIIFGDSHLSLVIFSRFIMVFLIFYIYLMLFEKYKDKTYFIGFNFILTYVLLSTYSSKLNLFSSLSEWPTWILGLIIIKLLLSKDYDFKSLHLMSFLLGTCFLIRENQLPGLLYLIFLIMYLKKDKKSFIQLLSFFSVFIFLPFLHNFIYGGKFVLNQDVFISGYYYLSPLDLLFKFNEVSDKLIFQLNYLLANPLSEGVRIMSGKIFPLTISIIIIQWIFFFLLKNKNLQNFFYFLIPLSFLGPHIFYQVHTYFPRHIIQGYLFMIASTLLINLNKTNKI